MFPELIYGHCYIHIAVRPGRLTSALKQNFIYSKPHWHPLTLPHKSVSIQIYTLYQSHRISHDLSPSPPSVLIPCALSPMSIHVLFVLVQSSLLQRAPRRKARSWCSKKSLQRSAEETVCTGRNQPSVMAARGLRPRQLALTIEKSQLWVRGREAWSRKGKTQETERASSIPVIFIPNLRLSKMR